jgi:hypothetical protein
VPTRNSPGWHLQRRRPSEFGFVDRPLESGVDKSKPPALSGDAWRDLRRADMRALRPHDLKNLGQRLLEDGHISRLAHTQFALMTFDLGNRPVDILQVLQNDLQAVKGLKNRLYDLQISMYEAAIDALQGMKDAIGVRQVDTYA